MFLHALKSNEMLKKSVKQTYGHSFFGDRYDGERKNIPSQSPNHDLIKINNVPAYTAHFVDLLTDHQKGKILVLDTVYVLYLVTIHFKNTNSSRPAS